LKKEVLSRRRRKRGKRRAWDGVVEENEEEV
jgi:hypothetical protein